MANDLLNPPETETTTTEHDSQRNGSELRYSSDPATRSLNTPPAAETGHELDAFLGKAFEEKPMWAGLFESIHDLFFPPKLPPLELTSKPIDVPDPMAVKRSPVAVGISIAVNVGILAILLFAFRNQINKVLPPSLKFTDIDTNLKPYIPVTPKAGKMGGGGGGGSHDIAPPIKGKLPEIKKAPLLQPQVPILEKPKLAINPAINVQENIKLPDNPNLPTIGVTSSPNVSLASNGQGSNGGMGTGSKGGLGSGNGNGYGPGTGGNTGGGLYKVGNGVTGPKVIYSVEAEFSDEARRAKYEGVVLISLIVDAQGNPQNVHVARTLGMGLDEKAIEAVKQYKFKPAFDSKSGKNVPVQVNFEVGFHLY